jgi:hypothetical protein
MRMMAQMNLSLVLTLSTMVCLADLSVNKVDDLTMAGFTFSELIELYRRNININGSEDVALSVDRNINSDRIRENVYYIKPFSLSLCNNSLTNYGFIYVFSTVNILHQTRIYTYAVCKNDATLLRDDEHVIDFLNQHMKVVSEGDFRDFLIAFSGIRAFDIITKRPSLIDRENLRDESYPDTEWGVRCVPSLGVLRGFITVCTNVYSSTIVRYDFKLCEDGKVELSRQAVLFSGANMR